MKQSARRISFILAMLLLVSMIPLKAVAEELSPYDSVERPEEGVVIYHNKDGSYTMVVGASASSEKVRGSKNSGSEIQVQIEKQFQEGLPLATLEYAGGSISFFPNVSKQGDEIKGSTEETEAQDAKDRGSDLIPDVDAGSVDAANENAAINDEFNESMLGNETESETSDQSDETDEQDPGPDVTTEGNSSEDDENQGTEAQHATYIVSFIIPQDKEGQLLPLKELIVPANTDETELPLPKHLDAVDSEGIQKRVPVREWKAYRGIYGDQQKEWTLVPVLDEPSALLSSALSAAIEKDIFTALPHIIVRWIEEDRLPVEQEEDENALNQPGGADSLAAGDNESEAPSSQVQKGTTDAVLVPAPEENVPEENVSEDEALPPNADGADTEDIGASQSSDVIDEIPYRRSFQVQKDGLGYY